MRKGRSPAVPGPRAQAARCVALALALAAVAAFGPGCSGSRRGADVNPSAAQDALKAALEGWKKGEAPAALKGGTPTITVQDLDWIGGARLVDYRVDGEGKNNGPNLQVPVELTLKTPDGKQVQKKVSYIVGTSPYVTVFRALR